MKKLLAAAAIAAASVALAGFGSREGAQAQNDDRAAAIEAAVPAGAAAGGSGAAVPIAMIVTNKQTNIFFIPILLF